ncbi:hypothetical protein PUN28_000354 [Cardiocondyla obscurior]|uniref:Uncharacterized protein n=1 Tax=Cardiocondyla obscurior TaxID=286306 RepID=A0AAW2GYZ7_9HYME
MARKDMRLPYWITASLLLWPLSPFSPSPQDTRARDATFALKTRIIYLRIRQWNPSQLRGTVKVGRLMPDGAGWNATLEKSCSRVSRLLIHGGNKHAVRYIMHSRQRTVPRRFSNVGFQASVRSAKVPGGVEDFGWEKKK